MRILGWLIIMGLNAGLALMAATAILRPGLPIYVRLAAVLAVIAALAAVTFLFLAGMGRIERRGISAMRWICPSYPILWLLGSLDEGNIAVSELVFVLLIFLFAWVTWKAFLFFAAQGLRLVRD